MYTVHNNCGGTIYCGRSLARAVEAATEYYAEPYIYSETGRRPVIQLDEGTSIGEVGESWEDFADRMD